MCKPKLKRYVTEYEKDGHRFGGEVDAYDLGHAEQIAAARNPPETVMGVLHLKVRADHWTAADADRVTRALAEMDGEAPDASEFD